MKEKLRTTLDERGVSPVIGVILMVAITVILAAVIGSFVLGIGGDIEQAPQASIEVSSSAADTITVTHNGGDPLPGDSKVAIKGTSDSATLSSELTAGSSTDVTITSYSGTEETVQIFVGDNIILEEEVEFGT